MSTKISLVQIDGPFCLIKFEHNQYGSYCARWDTNKKWFIDRVDYPHLELDLRTLQRHIQNLIAKQTTQNIIEEFQKQATSMLCIDAATDQQYVQIDADLAIQILQILKSLPS